MDAAEKSITYKRNLDNFNRRLRFFTHNGNGVREVSSIFHTIPLAANTSNTPLALPFFLFSLRKVRLGPSRAALSQMVL